jgi:hypothetical protein
MAEDLHGTAVDLLQGPGVELSTAVVVEPPVDAGDVTVGLGIGGRVVGHHQDGHPPLEFGEQVQQIRLGRNVHGSRRFVEEKGDRIGDQGAGDQDPLELAAGKMVDVLMPLGVEAEFLEDRPGLLPAFGRNPLR